MICMIKVYYCQCDL